MEVADILRRHAPSYPYSLSGEQARVLAALQVSDVNYNSQVATIRIPYSCLT